MEVQSRSYALCLKSIKLVHTKLRIFSTNHLRFSVHRHENDSDLIPTDFFEAAVNFFQLRSVKNTERGVSSLLLARVC